jgi:hypothetical protein
MKFSKNLFLSLVVFLAFVSCQTRVVSPNRPMRDNSVELYKKYTIQTKDAKTQKVEVLKVDNTKIYGKNKAGEMVEIEKSEVREIRKPDILSSIIIVLAGVAAVVFIPV